MPETAKGDALKAKIALIGGTGMEDLFDAVKDEDFPSTPFGRTSGKIYLTEFKGQDIA
jgi:purine nucleoside phosphorylase